MASMRLRASTLILISTDHKTSLWPFTIGKPTISLEGITQENFMANLAMQICFKQIKIQYGKNA
jgi:hypothetical protein